MEQTVGHVVRSLFGQAHEEMFFFERRISEFACLLNPAVKCTVSSVCSVTGRWRDAAWRGVNADKEGGGWGERHKRSWLVRAGGGGGQDEEVRETSMRSSREWRRGSGTVQLEGCCSRCFSTFESKVGDPGSARSVVVHLRSVQPESMLASVERSHWKWVKLSKLLCLLFFFFYISGDIIKYQLVKEIGYSAEARFCSLILVMQNCFTVSLHALFGLNANSLN